MSIELLVNNRIGSWVQTIGTEGKVVSERRVRSAGELAAVARDNGNHFMREIAFDLAMEQTVFPEAVNRWIRECGQ